VRVPDVSYARSGALSIAYQVVGNGSRDLVWVRAGLDDMLMSWERPEFHECMDELNSAHESRERLRSSTTACSPRCCSPTSSPRRSAPPSSATKPGRTSCSSITRSSVGARALPRIRGRHGRRRVLRDVRRPGPRDPLRVRDYRARRSDGACRRAGIHTGECEIVDGKVAGIAVNIGARVSAVAGPGQVFVTSTVRDLVAGSSLRFDDHGECELKGVPRRWRLYRVWSDANAELVTDSAR
jgi:hypothetical protein